MPVRYTMSEIGGEYEGKADMYNWVGRGATPDAAVDDLRARAVKTGVVAFFAREGENPLAAVAGYAAGVKDHPLWQEWRRAVEERRNREEVEQP